MRGLPARWEPRSGSLYSVLVFMQTGGRPAGEAEAPHGSWHQGR